MKKRLFIVFIFWISCQELYSQTLNEWSVYPSFSTVNSLSVADGLVFNGTLGGIFSVRDGNVELFTTMDGLYRSNPTSLIIDDAQNRVFAGYVDGTIDVIDLENMEINRLEDIRRVNQFNSKTINSFIINGQELYVATDFGIVVYDLDNLLVENSFMKLGTFDTGIQVNHIDIFSDTLYAATVQGVAIGDITTNLIDSDNWSNFDSQNGLPSDIISDIKHFNNTIYVISEGLVYSIQNGLWEERTQFSSGVNSLKVSMDRQRLGAATDTRIIVIDDQQNLDVIMPELNSSITDFYLADDEILIGTSSEGLKVREGSSGNYSEYLPSGPYLNFFNDLIHDEGVLVSTSTSEFPGSDPFNPIRGYYILSEGTWTNYNQNTNSSLAGMETVFKASSNESSYYLGSWGKGIIEHEKTSNNITVYNGDNSNLTGIFSDPEYIVISGLDRDLENNMWAVSYNSEFPLYAQMDGVEEWIPFQGLSGSDNYFELFIDSFDQKWISLITNTNTGLGLLVIDTGDPEDPNDDISVKLTSSPNNGNLPNEKIKSIKEDKNNEVWIGTERGIARFVFPELIIEGGTSERQAQWLINEDTTATSRFLLRDVNISAMAINAANQKWIGSENQGLWLLNEDGSRIEKRFTVENSDLISNNINSISINNKTGEVFIATDLGLISYLDIPKAPVNEMGKLKVFPNPFQYARHNQVVIEGLSDATRIKILGVDGFVVNELQAQGGRVSWDGYDYNGNELGTGVYFVIAYEESGRQRGIGKVVIVK